MNRFKMDSIFRQIWLKTKKCSLVSSLNLILFELSFDALTNHFRLNPFQNIFWFRKHFQRKNWLRTRAHWNLVMKKGRKNLSLTKKSSKLSETDDQSSRWRHPKYSRWFSIFHEIKCSFTKMISLTEKEKERKRMRDTVQRNGRRSERAYKQVTKEGTKYSPSLSLSDQANCKLNHQ